MTYFTENTQYALGIDLSRYNTSADGKLKVNFDIIAAHRPKVVFIAMRAGISWAYQDPWFAYYFTEAKRVGCLRLPYHVVYPGESPQKQMEHFLRLVGEADLEKIRLVLDLELDHGLSKTRITAAVLACLRFLEERTGRLPIVYSRATWVDAHLFVSDLPDLDWWLAQYRWPRPYPLFTAEYPCPPSLPAGVKPWLIHQTTEKGPGIGTPGRYYLDYNRWNGTETDVRAYFGLAAPTTVICPLDGLVCTTKS